ncbi:sensor histidine kinase, partial [uncultured Clostridium sp.]|uniref:sensor histidine kinase n=1 Tax=uncultured Clostridium sp. TaxID=59620 RepID=UPI002673EB12
NTITELDLINMNLNNMIKEINTLIEDNKRIDEEKIEVEVKVLQSQITSHFIFNTLNSIRILAFINNDNEVGMQIQNFIALIRNNFTRGNMHTVKEEVYSIQSYCDLMKLRYGEKFSVVINVDEELNSKKILKLILQPIIENSITHGFSMKNFEGEILINISKVNNKMVIEILDNGVGISEEDMKKIMTGSTTGIAIYNSNRRIKLYYGDDYGINIESEVNKYTKSIIVLPIID